MCVAGGVSPVNADSVLHLYAVTSSRYLGLSIVGGTDAPVQPGDNAIYAMEIVEEGAAASDGRLRAADKLLVCNGKYKK